MEVNGDTHPTQIYEEIEYDRCYENLLIIIAKIKAIYDFLLIILSPILWYNNYYMICEIKN
jgi:hypothetical protein